MAAFPLQPPGAVAEQLDALADVAPLGVNFLVPLMSDPATVTIAAERGRLVDFYHASPDPELVGRAKVHGVAVAWQVGSVEDARRAIDAGVDLLVVRGIEGGGRLHGGRPLWPLLFDVLDAVGAVVPVLAAGGIATGRGLAAALAAGASGVRMGTAFVATEESGAHPRYKAALVAASGGDTVVTEEFSVMWPEGPRPSRVLRSALEAARDAPGWSDRTDAAGRRPDRVAPLRDSTADRGVSRTDRGDGSLRRRWCRCGACGRTRGEGSRARRRRGRQAPRVIGVIFGGWDR